MLEWGLRVGATSQRVHKTLPLKSTMELPTSRSIYPGDPVTDHSELVDFLQAQQDRINALSAKLERLTAFALLNQLPQPPES